MATNVRVAIPHWARNQAQHDPWRWSQRLIREFRTACQDFGLLSLMREQEHYVKPGEERRRKKRQSEARKKQAALRDQYGHGYKTPAEKAKAAKAKKKKAAKARQQQQQGR